MAKHEKNVSSDGASETVEKMTGDGIVGSGSPPPPPRDPIAAAVLETKPVEIMNKIVAKDIVKKSALNYKREVTVTKNAAGDEVETATVVDPAPRSLYRVFGVVRDIKHGDSAFGQWTAFLGSFEAVRFADHQRFQAPQCFLQGASEGLLQDAFTAARKGDPSATVGFAFDIGVKPSQKWAETGQGNSYEYTVKTVLDTQEHDPLKEMRALATAKLPALPAPPKA